MSKFNAWLALGAEILEVCDGVLKQADLDDADKDTSSPKVVALALLCRTANNYAAARLLLEQNFIVEARTLCALLL